MKTTICFVIYSDGKFPALAFVFLFFLLTGYNYFVDLFKLAELANFLQCIAVTTSKHPSKMDSAKFIVVRKSFLHKSLGKTAISNLKALCSRLGRFLHEQTHIVCPAFARADDLSLLPLETKWTTLNQ
jgi:hypothetical protein